MVNPTSRKLAAIMFCDMVGYSSLMSRNGELALQLLDELRKMIGDAVSKCRGRVVKELGDGFLVEFESARNAVYCGVELQQLLRERNGSAPEGRRVDVRIGLHLGDVVYRNGDVLGAGVNTARRIQETAEPGHVYMSQQVFDQIRNDPEVVAEEVGEEAFKGQIEPIRIYRIVPQAQGGRNVEGLGLRFQRKFRSVIGFGVAIMIGVAVLVYQFAYRGFELRPQGVTDTTETNEKLAPSPKKPPQTTEKEVVPEAKELQQNDSQKKTTPLKRQDRELEEKERLVAPESQESAGEKLTEGDGKPLVDWRDKKHWRTHLKVGLTKDEVRRLFGEPTRIYVSGTGELWEYREERARGSLTFFNDKGPSGQLHGWSEPD